MFLFNKFAFCSITNELFISLETCKADSFPKCFISSLNVLPQAIFYICSTSENKLIFKYTLRAGFMAQVASPSLWGLISSIAYE
jgi:hypothetical protein